MVIGTVLERWRGGRARRPDPLPESDAGAAAELLTRGRSGADERGASLFDGLSVKALGPAVQRLEHRRLPAGAWVLAEGESRREIYVVQSGYADIVASDGPGAERRVDRVGPGGTLGETSLLTGQPAPFAVRAATDLELLVLKEGDFHRAAAAFPQIYRNVGAILAERLNRSQRFSRRRGAGRATLLVDAGAPPLLGYALACSLAWHTRAATLLVVVAESWPFELEALADRSPPDQRPSPLPRELARDADGRPAGARAHLLLAAPTGAFAGGRLAETVESLSGSYEHVLVQVRDGRAPLRLSAGRLRLGGAHDADPGHRDGSAYTVRAWLDAARRNGPNRDGVVAVSVLGASDHRALRAGVLETATPAGRALGWVARDLAGLKVGLALGAGSNWGYAHFGVLRMLERAGLPIDYLVGTSIGAVVAALHAAGYSPDTGARLIDAVSPAAFRPTVSRSALLSNSGVRAGLRRIAGTVRFEDLLVPLGIVTADLLSCQEVVFRDGLLWPPLLASLSIPGIYPPQPIGQHLLVDGGLVSPVPSRTAREIGADKVVAVRLMGPPASAAGSAASNARPPSLLRVLARTLETMQSTLAAGSAATADVLITPVLDEGASWTLRNFAQGRRYVEAGEAAAEAALPRIGAVLPWLGR